MRFGIGQPVTRKEDPRFLTGRGRYVADLDFVREAQAVFVFSPHAHARIRAVDKRAAEAMPGVFAVLTGADWAADGLGALDPEVMPEDMGGPKGYRTRRPPLAQGRVRHVGERVAIVIAATEAQARDAAEAVAVDYEILPAAVTVEDAVRPGAPAVHDEAAGNTAFMLAMGNADASAITTRGPAAGRSTPARRTCMASARPWRIKSCMSRRAVFASSPAMSAAGSA